MKTQFEQYELDQMRNNPNNNKCGFFYYNPQDPRTIVPKRNQWMGWTLNFGNFYTYLIIILFIALIVFIENLDRIF